MLDGLDTDAAWERVIPRKAQDFLREPIKLSAEA
jgi:hypothetical protein